MVSPWEGELLGVGLGAVVIAAVFDNGEMREIFLCGRMLEEERNDWFWVKCKNGGLGGGCSFLDDNSGMLLYDSLSLSLSLSAPCLESFDLLPSLFISWNTYLWYKSVTVPNQHQFIFFQI